MSATPAHIDVIACPRCGYDLRGVVESWEEVCPMLGTCAECGLEFEWGELLSPRRMRPVWCVEFALGWTIVLAAFKTVLILFFKPRKFWRELKMTHEPNWPRMTAIAIPLLLAGYLVFAGSVSSMSFNQYRRAKQSLSPAPLEPIEIGIYAALNPFSNYGSGFGFYSPRDYARRFRPSDIWQHSLAAIRTNAFLLPWRTERWWWKPHSIFLAHGIMLVVLCPLAFLALPQSLRQAKVRWRHIARIGLYSLAALAPPFILLMHFQISTWSRLTRFGEYSAFGMLLFPAACMIIWWSLAAKHYLKLPHSWGVGICMVVLAYASGLFTIALIDFLMI